MAKIRTFIDSGVLLSAARGDDETSARAIDVLDDPDRELITSDFVRLEVLPKAVYHRRSVEVAFYEAFFQAVRRTIKSSGSLIDDAVKEAESFGLSAVDALHAAAAKRANCRELVTAEKKTKPLFRVTGLTAITVRRAFTLVELLVVVAIIGALLALLLPAVQTAREASRRASCQNNQRQLGLALHNFHGVYRVLPASGWTTAGAGNPKGKFVGWRPLVLPYLEEASLQRAYDSGMHWWEGGNVSVGLFPLAVFRCPTVPERREVNSAIAKPPRPALTFPGPLAPTDYEAIMGVQASVDPERYATPTTNRAAMYRNSSIRMTQILDGTSSTILLVECAARPLIYRGQYARPDLANDQGQGWIDSEGPFSLDGSNEDGSIQGGGPVATPVALNATNENEPYSFHTGGGNFLFADGHVQFVGETIRLEVFAGLCTRAGGEW